MRPGFDTELRDDPIPRSAPTATDTWFVVGPTERGTTSPKLTTSADAWADEFGGSVPFSSVPDGVQEFYLNGGARVVTKRVVGAGAVKATKSFNDSTPAPTLAIDARDPGEAGNRLKPSITVAGGKFSITLLDEDLDEVVSISPEFATKAEAVAWSQENDYIRVRSLAPNTMPVAAAAASLAGGDDDIDSVDNDDYVAALATLTKQLGPGQVSIVGATTEALRTAVLAHCAAHNRRGILAAPDSGSVSTLKLATLSHKSDVNSRFGAMFGPWDIVPGRIPSVTKTVPPEGRIAGQIARVDRETGNPNQPAAGEQWGTSSRLLGITQSFTDDEYTELNEAGVNMTREIFGGDWQTYGFRTLVDPDEDERWVEFSGSRTIMYITAHGSQRMASFAFDNIDGQGHKFSELEGAIKGILLPLYNPPLNALFGRDPADAYSVVADATVNTPERVKNRQLRAVVAVRTSPFAEHIVTEIVRRTTTEEV